MPAANIFNVLNKHTGENQLIKADTKRQVSKFLADGFDITKVSAVEAVDAMAKGAKLLDASNVVDDGGGRDNDAGNAGGDPVAGAGAATGDVAPAASYAGSADGGAAASGE